MTLGVRVSYALRAMTHRVVPRVVTSAYSTAVAGPDQDTGGLSCISCDIACRVFRSLVLATPTTMKIKSGEPNGKEHGT